MYKSYSIQTKRAYQKRYDRMDSGRNFAEAMEAMARVIRSETNINDSPHKVRLVSPEPECRVLLSVTCENGEWK